MVDCKNIQPQLNLVWSEFRQLGITDDLTIFENLAAIFLFHHYGILDEFVNEIRKTSLESFKDFPTIVETIILPFANNEKAKNLIPRFSSSINFRFLETLIIIIQDVLKFNDAGEIFNECVIKRQDAMHRGGRYPTPRHITSLLVALAEVYPGMQIADLACGTGGILVALGENQSKVMGIEISPNLARIAWTNLILNGFEKPEIYITNTYDWVRKILINKNLSEIDPQSQVDRIIMNPPFGEKVSGDYAINKIAASSRSEAVFSSLGLDMLKPGGRLVTLVPTGILFSNSIGERSLRERLIQEHQIQAIISLPIDAFQPYSSLKIHILVADKSNSINLCKNVWFYDVRHDGFTSGRNRIAEPNLDEIPRLLFAFLHQHDEASHKFTIDSKNTFDVLPLISEKQDNFGYRFSWDKSQDILIEKLDFNKKSTPNFRIKVGSMCLYISSNAEYLEGISKQQAGLQLPEPTVSAPVSCHIQTDSDTEISLNIDEEHETLKSGRTTRQLQPHDAMNFNQPKIMLIDLNGMVFAGPYTLPLQEIPRAIRPNPFSIWDLQNDDDEIIGYIILLRSLKIQTEQFRSRTSQLHLIKNEHTYLSLWFEKDNSLGKIKYAEVTSVYKSVAEHTGIILDIEGEWYGVRVSKNAIIDQKYNLEPERYFPQEEVAETLESPAKILADIKTKQVEMGQRLNFLLGVIGKRKISKHRIPPAVATDLTLLGSLTLYQKQIWEEIKIKTDLIGIRNEQYETPQLFQPKDLEEVPTIDLLKTLELLERMGLIVSVTIDNAPYFRLLSEADIEGEE